ncbi:MFS transporter [bacterium]|nr:MAG: MFS transporter [bacterium]
MSSDSGRICGARGLALLNVYWAPLSFQDAALMAIAVPASLVRLAPGRYTSVLAVLASLVAMVAMFVPPVAGAVSDRLRRAGGMRRTLVLTGAGLDALCLLAMAQAHSTAMLGALLLLSTAGECLSIAAYQALIPEIVPRAAWGSASGVRGAATLAGTVAGLAVAGLTEPATTFVAAAVVVLLGAATVLGIPEGAWSEPEHAHVADRHDFAVVFASRSAIMFGMTLLMTFVLYFFRDVLKVENPSAGTGLVAGAALVGAIVSSIWLGALSDRVIRKGLVASAGVPMALAAFGFALVPQQHWILAFALVFGLGYGGFIATDWALAIDSVPRLRDVARDLGIWGIASSLPAIVAPAFGGWLLARYGATLDGYRVLFTVAAASFALGSLIVLSVGARPLSPLWGMALRLVSVCAMTPYVHAAYRVRGWGRLPFARGATLVIANHQHDLDTMAVVLRLTLDGPWRHPVFAAASRRLFEPGFMALRIRWLERLLRRLDSTTLFGLLGMLPIENQLYARPLASMALGVRLRHGDVALGSVFRAGALALLPAAAHRLRDLERPALFYAVRASVQLSQLRQPYRGEMLAELRAQVESDLERLAEVLRRGGTLFLTPEGRHTLDGSLSRLRGALRRLAPLGDVRIAAISYDPLLGRRLSLLYRVIAPADRGNLEASLAVARPVTVSQLLSDWLAERVQPFTPQEAVDAVAERLRALPALLFVDPVLRARPMAVVRAALATMRRLGMLRATGGRLRLVVRSHPKFPGVDDVVAFQARFFRETLAGAQWLSAHSIVTAGGETVTSACAGKEGAGSVLPGGPNS